MRYKIEALNNVELMERFEDALKCDHYCPTCKCTHDYTLSELRKEINRRLEIKE